jgi:lysine 2,3-aminomutase
MIENLNWKNNFLEAFKNSTDLFRFLDWPAHEALLVEKAYPIFMPRRIAQRIKEQGPHGILAKEFLPSLLEINSGLNQMGFDDPIGDKSHLVAPQLIHRYQSRALFTPTSICPINCRYCFRKNELNPTEEIFLADFDLTLSYLKNHPEIKELIFTGGDPLTLSNDKIKKYLEAFCQIPSIRDIRFHTRFPVILPERIDFEFIQILSDFRNKFRTLSVAIHVNHEDELDSFVKSRIRDLALSNVQLLSQTVLLRGVNDSVIALTNLFNTLLDLNIRPYYLHHPDQVKGGLHFYLPLEFGRKIYSQLRDMMPGWALPQYVIDIPQGKGKVSAFNPEEYKFSGSLIGRDGTLVPINEPDLFRPEPKFLGDN